MPVLAFFLVGGCKAFALTGRMEHCRFTQGDALG